MKHVTDNNLELMGSADAIEIQNAIADVMCNNLNGWYDPVEQDAIARFVSSVSCSDADATKAAILTALYDDLKVWPLGKGRAAIIRFLAEVGSQAEMNSN